jgi:hypothetical protein
MTQFVAFDAKTEVLGTIISTFALALGSESHALLERHGLGSFDLHEWYPQQKLLDVLKDASVGDLKAMFDLVGAGTKVPQVSISQVSLSEIKKLFTAAFGEFNPYTMMLGAFTSQDPMSFRNVHRNGYPGKYEVNRTGTNTVDVLVETPYPCDFDYGVIWGNLRVCFGSELDFVVRHAEGSCRKNGTDTCLYHIEWGQR